DPHGRLLGNEFGQQAFVFGIQMLNQNEGHAGIVRKASDQFGEGFDSAGRRADGGNQELVTALESCGTVFLRRTTRMVTPRRLRFHISPPSLFEEPELIPWPKARLDLRAGC